MNMHQIFCNGIGANLFWGTLCFLRASSTGVLDWKISTVERSLMGRDVVDNFSALESSILAVNSGGRCWEFPGREGVLSFWSATGVFAVAAIMCSYPSTLHSKLETVKNEDGRRASGLGVDQRTFLSSYNPRRTLLDSNTCSAVTVSHSEFFIPHII